MTPEELKEMAAKCGVSYEDAKTVLGLLVAMMEIRDHIGVALKMAHDGEFWRIEKLEELFERINRNVQASKAFIGDLHKSLVAAWREAK